MAGRGTHDLSAAEILASAKLMIAEYGDGAEAKVRRQIVELEADPEQGDAIAWIRILESIENIRFKLS